jgi:hypothetical protein
MHPQGDLVAVAVCVVIAVTFAVCIAREHRESVIRWIHRAPNPLDADVGPPEPHVVDGSSSYGYGDAEANPARQRWAQLRNAHGSGHFSDGAGAIGYTGEHQDRQLETLAKEMI